MVDNPEGGGQAMLQHALHYAVIGTLERITDRGQSPQYSTTDYTASVKNGG
jgi:hypothetical protein